MPKFSGCLMAALLASALAMPTNAGAEPPKKGAVAAPRVPHRRCTPRPMSRRRTSPRSGGGAPHFAARRRRSAAFHRARRGGAPHFTARSGGTPHFTRHVGTPHVTNRTATVNRSLHVTQPNQATGSITRGSSSARLHDRIRHEHEQHNLAHHQHERAAGAAEFGVDAQRADQSPLPPQRHRRHQHADGAARPLRLALCGARAIGSELAFRPHGGAPGLASPSSRRLRRLVRAGVLALRLFRYFRLRVLARGLRRRLLGLRLRRFRRRPVLGRIRSARRLCLCLRPPPAS